MDKNSCGYRIDFLQAKKVFYYRTVPAADQEKSAIGIRVNDVLDSCDQLTGYLEVGLWVEKPTLAIVAISYSLETLDTWRIVRKRELEAGRPA